MRHNHLVVVQPRDLESSCLMSHSILLLLLCCCSVLFALSCHLVCFSRSVCIRVGAIIAHTRQLCQTRQDRREISFEIFGGVKRAVIHSASKGHYWIYWRMEGNERLAQSKLIGTNLCTKINHAHLNFQKTNTPTSKRYIFFLHFFKACLTHTHTSMHLSFNAVHK